MLDDLGTSVDRTENKLGSAMKKMQKFIRDTEGGRDSLAQKPVLMFSSRAETKSGWCITILIIILCALLLAVVLL